MKNRKRIIATLACMSLTSQMLPSAYTIVANAQTTKPVEQQQKTGLSKTLIKLCGVACEEKASEIHQNTRDHELQITFDDTDSEDIKLIPTVITGYPNTGHPFQPYFNGNYITLTLSNCYGRIKNTVSLAGYENISKLKDALDKWDCHYGDYISIYHSEYKYRCKVFDKDNKEINKSNSNMCDFEITKGGLKPVEPEKVRQIIEVKDSEELTEALNTLKLKKDEGIIKLKDDINFSTNVNLEVPQGVSINGNNHYINLGQKASLVLKGNYTGLSSVTIKNAPKDGVQIYNSIYSYLSNVTVEGSNYSGLLVNGSDVTLDNCTTRNNKQGGVMICESIPLEISAKKAGKEAITPKVTVVGGLKSEEKSCVPDVVVKNLTIENHGKAEVNQKGSFIKFKGNDIGGERPGFKPAQNYTEKTEKKHTRLSSSYYDTSIGFDKNTNVLETYTMYKLNK